MTTVISRKYEVIGQLGRGGMGVVYKARHLNLETILAVKVLPSSLMEDQAMVARFYREAWVMARLSHPNIVRVVDIDRDGEHDFYYFVMEYIQGKKEEARQLLTEIYGWFTEGFGTPDLKLAKTLLEELK
jgi:serine/threonine protein kinase